MSGAPDYKCDNCGTPDKVCEDNVRAGKQACCGRCRYTDTHHVPVGADATFVATDHLKDIVIDTESTIDPSVVVKEAVSILSDRSDKYDNRNLAVPTKMAKLMSAYFDREFTAEDACMIMVFHKLARQWVDGDDMDHVVDGAAYLSLAWKARKDAR